MERLTRDRNREKYAFHVFRGGNLQNIIDLLGQANAKGKSIYLFQFVAHLKHKPFSSFLVQLERAIIYAGEKRESIKGLALEIKSCLQTLTFPLNKVSGGGDPMNITPAHLKTLQSLKSGVPIPCDPGYGSCR